MQGSVIMFSMLGNGFFFFCFLIVIGYFLYIYFSYFGVNVFSIALLITLIIVFGIIYMLVLPKLWDSTTNSMEQFLLQHQQEM